VRGANQQHQPVAARKRAHASKRTHRVLLQLHLHPALLHARLLPHALPLAGHEVAVVAHERARGVRGGAVRPNQPHVVPRLQQAGVLPGVVVGPQLPLDRADVHGLLDVRGAGCRGLDEEHGLLLAAELAFSRAFNSLYSWSSSSANLGGLDILRAVAFHTRYL